MSSNFNCSYMAKNSLTYIPGFSVKCFFQPPRTIPGRFGLIWFSSFREDLNVIFYQNMPNLHNRYKLAERKISQKNPGRFLDWVPFKIVSWQTCPPFKMAAVTKSRNFFNCSLLFYYKSKWDQIFTALHGKE
jgi:hypothetical protein